MPSANKLYNLLCSFGGIFGCSLHDVGIEYKSFGGFVTSLNSISDKSKRYQVLLLPLNYRLKPAALPSQPLARGLHWGLIN